jgi:hypothetical protein
MFHRVAGHGALSPRVLGPVERSEFLGLARIFDSDTGGLGVWGSGGGTERGVKDPVKTHECPPRWLKIFDLRLTRFRPWTIRRGETAKGDP